MSIEMEQGRKHCIYLVIYHTKDTIADCLSLPKNVHHYLSIKMRRHRRCIVYLTCKYTCIMFFLSRVSYYFRKWRK